MPSGRNKSLNEYADDWTKKPLIIFDPQKCRRTFIFHNLHTHQIFFPSTFQFHIFVFTFSTSFQSLRTNGNFCFRPFCSHQNIDFRWKWKTSSWKKSHSIFTHLTKQPVKTNWRNCGNFLKREQNIGKPNKHVFFFLLP